MSSKPDGALLTLILKVIVQDKDGKILVESAQPGRSSVRALLECILALMGEANVSSVRLSGAAGTLATGGGDNMLAEGPVTLDTRGIVIGTGFTAVDITDYALATQIAHGTGTGQMSHGVQVTPTAVTVSGDTVTFDLDRTFTNNSGAIITVRECGVYFLNEVVNFCAIRDIITPVAVPALGTIRIVYTLKMSI